MIDLHIHTTHSSDGQYRPEEIFDLARRGGVTTLAFTDHMDINANAVGLKKASAFDIEFFSGLEISTAYDSREYHLLLYGFDQSSDPIHEFLRHHCFRIWSQAKDFIEYFQNLGFDIRGEDIDGWGKSVPTGVTFLNALKKRNADDERLYDYIHGVKSRSPYLNFYKDFSLTNLGEAISAVLPPLPGAIRKFADSGILILAHPGKISTEVLSELKDCGLSGIEVYSSHHTQEETLYLRSLARSLGLFAGAGSDFHGELIKPDVVFGDVPGQPDESLIQAIRNFTGK